MSSECVSHGEDQGRCLIYTMSRIAAIHCLSFSETQTRLKDTLVKHISLLPSFFFFLNQHDMA